jgi:hypothetical protein
MSSTKSKGLCRKYQKAHQISDNSSGLITEFVKAYNTLEECIAQKDRHGYQALINRVISESSPPCNIGYLAHKIKLDKEINKAIERIYRLVNLQ